VQTEEKLENIGARHENLTQKALKPVVLKVGHMASKCTYQLYKWPQKNDRKLGGHSNF
jgi:hypothetical protein